MLSGEGVGPKKLVLVVDRIDVLGKHADGKKVMKMGPLHLVSEHPGNSAVLGLRLGGPGRRR